MSRRNSFSSSSAVHLPFLFPLDWHRTLLDQVFAMEGESADDSAPSHPASGASDNNNNPAVAAEARWTCEACGCHTNTETDTSCTICGTSQSGTLLVACCCCKDRNSIAIPNPACELSLRLLGSPRFASFASFLFWESQEPPAYCSFSHPSSIRPFVHSFL